MDIKDYTVEQLKAMAYDCFANIEQNQANLRTINQLINQKTMDQDREAQTHGANQEGEATDGRGSQPTEKETV